MKTGFYKTIYHNDPDLLPEFGQMTSAEAKKEFIRLNKIHNGTVEFKYLAKDLDTYMEAQNGTS
tara:strand:- start:899 stop:1090 length:192 start_codon:yes stop_codon:yes gene_type:complete